DELFKRADVVSLHCPLTGDNEGFVNASLLDSMKPSAFLINTSRGPLIDEADLAAALEAGTLAGAALDVVSAEPIKADNPMLKAKNCLLTPHIAWATIEARTRLMQTTVENVAGFIKGEPVNVVN
ncbi:MAG TPA: NAD(P)-dependent oxidoreductase, partial [Opitutales bacterium]|nr:NAD(P)-dependent oxidoreductase [Opitutales bacterium]